MAGRRQRAMPAMRWSWRKGWRLRHITVRLRHERVHATDCAGCETPTSLLDHIQRELTFDGDLSDEQRARLLAIAERCPVHRTLHSEALVSTTESVRDRPDG
jgi:putative redox protein